MAQLLPSLDIARTTAANQREVDVLVRLADGLSDGFRIFHSVEWHSVHESRDRHGELDIVVLDPSGRVALLEVKAGGVDFRDGQIFKTYSNGDKDVGRQVRVQYSALRARLQAARLRPYLSSFLVLPDYRVEESHIVALPPERIIDARGFDDIGARIRDALAAGYKSDDVDALHRFFANQFDVAPDLSVLGEHLKAASVRLSEGLATWIPRIKAPSRIVRVSATAGSGKTQLAMRLLSDAADAGSRALYVCFNRSLADHMGHLATPRARVVSFHELCVELGRRNGGEPDFSAPGVFDRLAEAYCQSPPDGKYELIVIDEGQDFDPKWVKTLIRQLAPSGRAYVFEDQSQRLYERPALDLGAVVEVACDDNFRSPRQVCAVINALGLADGPVRARGVFEGEVPGFHVFADEHELVDRTSDAVESLVARGIPLADIVVLSMRGLATSALMKAERIGERTVRRFSGNYTRDGEQIWIDGELQVETIHRFKGQSAGAIVLSEVDFKDLGTRERRLLFVGMTRARLAVELVIDAHAEAAIHRLLS